MPASHKSPNSAKVTSRPPIASAFAAAASLLSASACLVLQATMAEVPVEERTMQLYLPLSLTNV